jgi:hypothetical protein
MTSGFANGSMSSVVRLCQRSRPSLLSCLRFAFPDLKNYRCQKHGVHSNMHARNGGVNTPAVVLSSIDLLRWLSRWSMAGTGHTRAWRRCSVLPPASRPRQQSVTLCHRACPAASCSYDPAWHALRRTTSLPSKLPFAAVTLSQGAVVVYAMSDLRERNGLNRRSPSLIQNKHGVVSWFVARCSAHLCVNERLEHAIDVAMPGHRDLMDVLQMLAQQQAMLMRRASQFARQSSSVWQHQQRGHPHRLAT